MKKSHTQISANLRVSLIYEMFLYGNFVNKLLTFIFFFNVKYTLIVNFHVKSFCICIIMHNIRLVSTLSMSYFISTISVRFSLYHYQVITVIGMF